MKKKKTVGASQGAEDPLEAEIDHLGRQLAGIIPPSASLEEMKNSRDVAFTRLVGIEPKDAVETMLGLQMVGANEAAMECLRRGTHPSVYYVIGGSVIGGFFGAISWSVSLSIRRRSVPSAGFPASVPWRR